MATKRTNHCEKCNRDITLNNWTKHETSCIGPKVKKIRGIDFDPNHGFKTGTRQAWNKGLDGSNPGVATAVKAMLSAPKKDLTIEQRDAISVRVRKQGFGGYQENAGRSKKFKIEDSFGKLVTVQSTYELATAEILNELGILWIRPGALKYDGRNYFPDFYLTELDLYLDPKNNYLAIKDAEKIRLASEQNNVEILILTKDKINIQFLGSLSGISNRLITDR